MNNSFVYLGCPYSDPNPETVKSRYLLIVEAAAKLAEKSIPCYCPIASWHVASQRHFLPGNHVFWAKQDQTMLNLCAEGWFIKLPGWEESKGMRFELQYLNKHGKSFCFLELHEVSHYASKNAWRFL